MTWLELIKLKLSEEKAKGKSPSIGDVTPLAKKEWVQIKEGKHPLYMQGKAQTFARKKKSGEGKTRKSKKGSASASASASIPADLLAKMCSKCKKKVEKYMQKKVQKGGNCTTCGGQGGGCGCTGPL